MAHNITSPLSPCEGMIKDLSLDAIQLCERDGKERFFSFWHVCAKKKKMFGALGRCNAAPSTPVLSLVRVACCCTLIVRLKGSRGRSLCRFPAWMDAGLDGWMDGWMVRLCVCGIAECPEVVSIHKRGLPALNQCIYSCAVDHAHERESCEVM